MDLPERERQALDWVRRIADPDFGDWDAHMRWLEEDPRNAEMFDRVGLGIEMASDGLSPAGPVPLPAVSNDNKISVRRRRWRVGSSVGGLVAAGAAAVFLWCHQGPGDVGSLIATPPGVSREIALADGSKLALNGGSKVRIEGDRTVALIDGEGYFQVVHHADRPFRVRIGSRVVQDVGTAFDVALAPGMTRVSVAQGIVAINPGAENIRLAAGQEARIGEDGQILRTTVTQRHAIGGWRGGRLVYQEASWTEVVTDLTRTLGVPVSLSPGMATRRFTGVIMLDHDTSLTIRRVADAGGVSAVPEGQGWRLASR